MPEKSANPGNLSAVLKNLEPGLTIHLEPGRYTEPVIIENFKGRPDQPLVITGAPGVVFDGNVAFTDFEPEACREIKRGDNYPNLAHIAYRGFFRIYNSTGITIDNLTIRRYWPTGIYFNASRHLRFANLRMEDATFAIYGEGDNAAHILVEKCDWRQDTSEMMLWSVLGWVPLHGEDDCICGARAFDGAFFRTRNIEGHVILRHNRIRHAANGIHMFNREHGKRRRGLNNNVQIYGNRFEYIRDNVIEPERRAVNWWVHHNEIFNCHKWFSLEMDSYGYFYIFGNRGWFDAKPGPADDEHTGGAVFKFPGKIRDVVGPIYVFNNSWYLRSSYIKKKKIQRFYHWDNAMAYCLPEHHPPSDCQYLKAFFGKHRKQPDGRVKKPFTKQWARYAIVFDNNCVGHPGYPHLFCKQGWAVEKDIGAYPLFTNPRRGRFEPLPLSPLIGTARPRDLELPLSGHWPPPGAPYPVANIGACQQGGIIEGPAFEPYTESKDMC